MLSFLASSSVTSSLVTLLSTSALRSSFSSRSAASALSTWLLKASSSSTSALLVISALSSAGVTRVLSSACTSCRSTLRSTSSTDALPSRTCVMSMMLLFTSAMLALRCSVAFMSPAVALPSICLSRDFTASPCALMTSWRALKVERITSWMFLHSFIPCRRSSTTMFAALSFPFDTLIPGRCADAGAPPNEPPIDIGVRGAPPWEKGVPSG
mmetsp:Transcript_1988/g.4489  ORF Transcript_1988/g.4489 Transcript_1988/m.4489 type:complete len:212 (+) Transcript_1988:23-658(+)